MNAHDPRRAGASPTKGPRTSQSTMLIFGLSLAFFLKSQAHEGHDSIAEVTLNRATHRLEVTLSVHTADLEQALSAATKRPVSLEQGDTTKLDTPILAYLTATFLIQDGQGTPLPLEWIGREPEGEAAHQTLLLHFEVILPKTISALTLLQRTFCELHNDQINLVEFRDGARKLTLGFSPQHGARTIAL